MKKFLLLTCLMGVLISCSKESDPEIEFDPPIEKDTKFPYIFTNIGIAFRGTDPTQLLQGTHSSWPHANVAYDKSLNKFVVFYDIKNYHELINNRVTMRFKEPEGQFSDLIVVADRMSENISCKTQASGIAANGDYISLVVNYDNSNTASLGVDVYVSKNKGNTWTSHNMVINNIPYKGHIEGFLVLKSGRILTLGGNVHIIYSDDNGITWNYASIPKCHSGEPAWCELSDGTIICYLRSHSATIVGYTTKSPAYFTRSYDGGLHWEEPIPSKSILNMNEANGHLFFHEDIKKVEFIHHSRFVENDGYSSLFQSAASEEDAKNDKMGAQVRIHYLPNQITGGDSGYIGAAKAANGIINAFYYSGTMTNADIHYMIGKKNPDYYK
jgi:hypothetical protein